jgi:uncharacterized protein (TIGR03067 family)
VAKNLPSRPNLDHLRSQAKTLLAQLKDGDAAAARTFIEFLPGAKRMSPARVRAAGFRLADAQSVVARKTGFGSWPLLSRYVQALRELEGEWRFAGLQVDGADVPAAALTQSRLLFDGDRFRMESPEANYDGVFTIDVGEEPMRIDIDFVEGPEAGNQSYGIFEHSGDQLTICLGVVGATRPRAFSTKPGSGHALERLRRASVARPAGVTGGTRRENASAPTASKASGAAPLATAAEAAAFDVAMVPMLRRLEGEWSAVQLNRDGEEMPDSWLSYGSRTTKGNETKVVFGGQVMVHAKMRLDERATPIAVDYLNLSGGQKGRISLGILEWVGDDVRFLMASPGQPRPSTFSASTGKGLTLSRWRRRD